MSGGQYNYAFEHVESFVHAMSLQGSGDAAPVIMRRAFIEHLKLVALAMKAVEWNDSGDGDPTEEKLIRAVVHPAATDYVAREQLIEAARLVLSGLGAT